MSETNLKNSSIQQSGYNNGLYYNHLLHFNQGRLNGQFPFLQGLMSNDLFPVWQKYDDNTALQTIEEDTNVVEENLEAYDNLPTVNNIEEQSSDTNSHHASDVSNEGQHADSVAKQLLPEPHEVHSEMLPITINGGENTLAPETVEGEHSQSGENVRHDQYANKGEESSDVAASQKMDIKLLHFEERASAIPNLETEILSIDEIQQGIKEVDAEETRKPKLKHSQKKILKENIIFFRELSELNTFNKWLIQQKPMEDGNFIKLLKLSKKARKYDKKIKLNQGIDASVQKNDKLVSEVLAKILASQGHYTEAIEMYRQLILSIPEKSATFAAQIDLLNQKII